MKTVRLKAPATVLLRVLVADTGVSINDSLTTLLSEFEGVSVFGCVQNPAKVLALVQTVLPDVVILDLQTGDISGLRALKQIKRLPAAPVVIVLAHYDQRPLRQAATLAGADHFLQKATDCERLQDLLASLWQEIQVRPPDRFAEPAGASADRGGLHPARGPESRTGRSKNIRWAHALPHHD